MLFTLKKSDTKLGKGGQTRERCNGLFYTQTYAEKML